MGRDDMKDDKDHAEPMEVRAHCRRCKFTMIIELAPGSWTPGKAECFRCKTLNDVELMTEGDDES